METDPVRLRQMLNNLLRNALKFTSQHGSVSLWVRRDSASRRLCFEVRTPASAFRPRTASGSSRPSVRSTRRTRGATAASGLGLAISRRLAKLLGGSLDVSSDVGRGSDVPPRDRQRRPARSRTSPGGERGCAAPAIRPGARILLAEDGPDNQRLIRALLRPRADVELVVVENGVQALDQALAALDSGEPFDLVLMDMQMPVMDGYEATRRLRRRAATTAPIVALTAHAMSDRPRALPRGAAATTT